MSRPNPILIWGHKEIYKKWTGCPLKRPRYLLLWLIVTSCKCLKRLQFICLDLSCPSSITKIPIKKIFRRPGMQNLILTLNQCMVFDHESKANQQLFTINWLVSQEIVWKYRKRKRSVTGARGNIQGCSLARPSSFSYMPWNLYYKLKTWHNRLLLKSVAFLTFTHLYTPLRLPNPSYAPENCFAQFDTYKLQSRFDAVSIVNDPLALYKWKCCETTRNGY